MVGCPSSHQQAGIREEALESGKHFRHHKTLTLVPEVGYCSSWPSTSDVSHGRSLKLEKYDSSTSVDSFLAKFQIFSKNNGWLEEDRLSWLQCSLTEDAAQMLWWRWAQKESREVQTL